MISDINVWRVILHNSVKDQKGNKIISDTDKERIVLEYYKNNNVVAIGFPVENLKTGCTFDEYKSKAKNTYAGKCSINVIKLATKVKANDLLWAKSEDCYYIAKVSEESKWSYVAGDNEKRLDVCNQITDINWYKVSSKELLSEFNRIDLPKRWSFRPTFQKIKNKEQIEFSKRAYNQTAEYPFYEVKKVMSDEFSISLDLLVRNKNLILQGAPGTGKTYKTAELALRLIGAIAETQTLSHQEIMRKYDEYAQKGQIEFVTFHQSMDYEDFVEGLKPEPIKDSNEENIGISYSVQPGVFKRICDAARINLQKDAVTDEANKAEFEKAWLNLADKLEAEDTVDIQLNQNKKFVLSFNKTGSGLSSKPVYKTDSDYTNYFSKEQLFNVFCGRKGVPSGGHDNYRKAIITYMKNSLGLGEYKEAKSSAGQHNYVLIIDEINRGNVSKIFGELISLIEKDKREPVDETKNSPSSHPLFATLPYSKERFSVPSNLYIIGTMNTTDRSVGSLDYALRRRFSFYTIKSRKELVDYEKAVQLFDAVKSFISSNCNDNILEMDFDDLMIGHSYFMVNSDEELDQRWEYEIKPLLLEYYKDGIIQEKVDSASRVDAFIRSYLKKNTGNDQNTTQLQNSDTSSLDNSSKGAQK